MTDERPSNEPPQAETRQQAQLRLLRARFGDRISAGPPPPPAADAPDAPDAPDVRAFATTVNEPAPDVSYLYETGRVLVRDEYLDMARGFLGDDATPDPDARQLDGVTVLQVGDVEEALRVIDRNIGRGVASRNHLVHIAGVIGFCPATEPVPVPDGTAPLPVVETDAEAGRGVRVVVADTGLDLSAAGRSSWLAGVTGEPDPGIPDQGSQEPLAEYAGHGTFIAGVVRCLAPAAEVHVRATFEIGGAALETQLVDGLIDILDNDNPDIISLSAGTWTHMAGDLLSLQTFGRRRLRLHKGVLLVAAAGNDNDRSPFWPAAAPYAVSVGSLDSALTGKAWFSNFGGWVDVYTAGDELVNAFPVGRYTGQEEGNLGVEYDFTGMARWSGTSFSTPLFAGLVAARMSKTGENGVDAAAQLLKLARKQAIPGLGATLRPGDAILKI
ncbi:S8/S53 family peptidase [Actinoplanes sp. NPDC051633]|uniref:S8/S53 family peptidase n=1 Tax=Actinoplanes sp. NPDC051633 TaxID=3155670 RepID=UPI003412C0F5